MPRSAAQLRADALRIWQAGLEAVRSERLVRERARVDGQWLMVGEDEPIDLQKVRRIAVVGAGKAGAGMAVALEEALGPETGDSKQLIGWVNVPADCVPASPHAGRGRGRDGEGEKLRLPATGASLRSSPGHPVPSGGFICMPLGRRDAMSRLPRASRAL